MIDNEMKTDNTMDSNYYCVIMAGGAGTRFWPVSRTARPKQFLDITGTGKSFLRYTFERFAGIFPVENIIVVTTARYDRLVMEQIPELLPENLLVEPYVRDTAPCIAYATYTILKRNPDATMVVSPADHLIMDEDKFRKTVIDALDYASKTDVLMTMGIRPTKADSNYGYIQAVGGKAAFENEEPMPVKTFTEKPDPALAKVFIDSGEFFWNAGIFAWNARIIRQEMEKYIPEVTRLFAGWENVFGTPVEPEFIGRAYSDCIKISIDYGVMEKTDRAWIYPARFGWADIGNWEALYGNYDKKDNHGNAFISGERLSDGNRNLLVYSKKKDKLMAIKGLDNFMVIDTDDVLLICPKDDRKFKDFIAGIAMPDYEEFR